jgi:hypothetical protein
MTTQFLATLQGELVDLGTLIQNKTIHTVEMPATNPAIQRYSANFNGRVKIGTNDLSVTMNGVSLNGSQTYTFGPSQPMLYVGAGQVPTSNTQNTLVFSRNGTTWYGLGTTVFNINGAVVCFNGKIWVAGQFASSSANTMAYSFDGMNWVGLGTTIFSSSCATIVWNGSLFVAGGEGAVNTLAYSYDGINWIGREKSVCANSCRCIGWNGNTWLAGGQTSGSVAQIASSPDGINWTAISTSVFTANFLGIAWNGTTWLAAGNGSSGVTLAYSINGITWTAVPFASTILTGNNGYGVAWNGSMWVAGGSQNIAYTFDPLARTGWVTSGGSFGWFNWNGKQFTGVGFAANTLSYSYNGINWIGLGTSVFSTGGRGVDFNSKRPHSITFPRFTVVAGGRAGTHTLAISYNGLTWSYLGASALSSYCLCVKYNGKIWVATGIGTNTMAYSYNGVNWTPIPNGLFPNILYALCWNGTIWVAGGSNGSWNFAYSYDGIMWVPTLANNVLFTGGFGVRYIEWNGKMFVATGQPFGSALNCLAYSYDGIRWTSANQAIFTDTGNGGKGLCWNGSIWIATGFGTNTIAYSYDGINWTGLGATIFTTFGWNVAWNGTMFVATGRGTNCTAYSYNGITWTGAGNSPFSAANGALGITWDGSRWHTGQHNSALSAYSYNGINWTTYTPSFVEGTIFFASTYNINPIPYIQQPAIAVGSGRNSLAYSVDGITWLGLGTTIFSQEACDVAWNGTIWIAMGIGGNSIAYSKDGINWTGLGTSIFTSGSAIAWNGNLWLASGAGTNTLAWSKNGINWNGLGRPVFSTVGYGIAWNGTAWVAMGQGSNTIAYSGDGISWTGIGTSTFSTSGSDIATNGIYWVATGQGTNSLAYTTTFNGSTGWTVVTSMNTTFNNGGSGIAWSGNTWVATGRGTSHTLAYSFNATTWTGAGITTFTTQGLGVCWNGVRFIATGQGGNSIAYSPNGVNWYRALNNFSNTSTTTIFTNYGNCVASNPTVGVPVVQSQMVLNPATNGQSTLDIVADPYYQAGFSNVSVKIEQNNIY